jgi:hypothetical protein
MSAISQSFEITPAFKLYHYPLETKVALQANAVRPQHSHKPAFARTAEGQECAFGNGLKSKATNNRL